MPPVTSNPTAGMNDPACVEHGVKEMTPSIEEGAWCIKKRTRGLPQLEGAKMQERAWGRSLRRGPAALRGLARQRPAHPVNCTRRGETGAFRGRQGRRFPQLDQWTAERADNRTIPTRLFVATASGAQGGEACEFHPAPFLLGVWHNASRARWGLPLRASREIVETLRGFSCRKTSRISMSQGDNLHGPGRRDLAASFRRLRTTQDRRGQQLSPAKPHPLAQRGALLAKPEMDAGWGAACLPPRPREPRGHCFITVARNP